MQMALIIMYSMRSLQNAYVYVFNVPVFCLVGNVNILWEKLLRSEFNIVRESQSRQRLNRA